MLGAAPCAWLHSRQVLWEWGRQAITDTAELIVSELATNGISASQGLTGSRYAGYWMPGAPPLRRWRHGEPQRIGIQVWDANDQMPRMTKLGARSDAWKALCYSLAPYKVQVR